ARSGLRESDSSAKTTTPLLLFAIEMVKQPRKIRDSERELGKQKSRRIPMIKSKFSVGCELNYDVSGSSAFIFNVGVVTNSFQRVLNEQFVTSPLNQVQESRALLEEKRHHRFACTTGPLRVIYGATVDLA